MEIIILVAVVFAVLTALVATMKNRNGLLWAFWGLLLGIFALLVVAILPKVPETKNQ